MRSRPGATKPTARVVASLTTLAMVGAVGAVGAAGVAAAFVGTGATVASAHASTSGPVTHRAATAAKKYTVKTNVPTRAAVKKRTITVSFSPKKPTTVKLQRWKSGKYVTIRTAKKPKGSKTSFTYTPTKGTTKLRAVATWPKKHRAVTTGKKTTWTNGSTTTTRPKSPTSSPSSALNAAGDPTANIAEPAALDACWNYGAGDSRCRTAMVAAINLGRTREGLPKFVLPANWTSLSAAQQLLVVSNDERAVRGLRPISRLSTPLNALALTGASTNSDPLLSGWTVEGKQAYGWASNWAISPGGPLYSDFLWMYDDGIGAGNIDCTATHTSGCWGHRHNILAFGEADSSTSLLLGAAEATTSWSGWTGLSDATLLVKVAS